MKKTNLQDLQVNLKILTEIVQIDLAAEEEIVLLVAEVDVVAVLMAKDLVVEDLEIETELQDQRDLIVVAIETVEMTVLLATVAAVRDSETVSKEAVPLKLIVAKDLKSHLEDHLEMKNLIHALPLQVVVKEEVKKDFLNHTLVAAEEVVAVKVLETANLEKIVVSVALQEEVVMKDLLQADSLKRVIQRFSH